MAGDQVLEEEAVPQQAGEEQALGQQSGVVQFRLVLQGTAQDLQAVHEVTRPEVAQAGLVGGRGHQGLGPEVDVRSGHRHQVEDGPHLVGEPRLDQVVDGDGRRSLVAGHARDGTATTSDDG